MATKKKEDEAPLGLDIFAAFATDKTKESEGVWKKIGGGTELLIARAGNPKFEKMILEEMETHRHALDTLPAKEREELDTKIFCRVVATTILLGWKNLRYNSPTHVPYSVAQAEEMLRHEDFRVLVMKNAQNMASYLLKAEAEDEKK